MDDTMKRDEMIRLLEAGIPIADVSVRKWEDIVARLGDDNASNNCAFCYVDEEKNSNDEDRESCNHCPCSDVCAGIYQRWANHTRACGCENEGMTLCDKAILCATDVLYAVREIRDREIRDGAREYYRRQE
jgi:hypothetical protein